MEFSVFTIILSTNNIFSPPFPIPISTLCCIVRKQSKIIKVIVKIVIINIKYHDIGVGASKRFSKIFEKVLHMQQI